MFESIRSLRELCEALSDQFAELRWRQLGSSFDTSRAAYRELKPLEDEERARIEAARRSRDNHEEEPFEIPPLPTLRS